MACSYEETEGLMSFKEILKSYTSEETVLNLIKGSSPVNHLAPYETSYREDGLLAKYSNKKNSGIRKRDIDHFIATRFVLQYPTTYWYRNCPHLLKDIIVFQLAKMKPVCFTYFSGYRPKIGMFTEKENDMTISATHCLSCSSPASIIKQCVEYDVCKMPI
ncbi:hypothetical protein VNO77_16596 [Canavalia gladiata]|uniref:Uncharacterized protein n=1 Tax=Canavalia gladiata TaxID=3824 RepID=A0AAN9LKY0_CANGL